VPDVNTSSAFAQKVLLAGARAVDIRTLLESEQDLRALSRALGLDCLEREGEINELRASNSGAHGMGCSFELALANLGDGFWDAVCSHGRPVSDAFVEDVVSRLLDVASAEPRLIAWFALRGLCVSGLRRWFATTRESFVLERGDPYPLVDAPIPGLLTVSTPQTSTTIVCGQLLWESAFTIHERASDAAMTVTFDYSRRDAIDAMVWGSPDEPPHFPRLGLTKQLVGF
jgi:hypothetical protein